MIVILNKKSDDKEFNSLKNWLTSQNLRLDISTGEDSIVVGLVGDTTRIDIGHLEALPIVEAVRRVSEPYKLANRKFHPEDTVVKIGQTYIGGGNFALIAGPCSVESASQMGAVAKAVKSSGAGMLRGGAFKPRTSPYAFQGLKEDGLSLLIQAGKENGLPVVSEVLDTAHVSLFKDVDMIQVGARNMQNFELLRELGRGEKPILLKRGLSSTIEELLMSAEYILSEGNRNVIICERGIRTYETALRNTLDLSAIPYIKAHSHLPVIVDPSHALGTSKYVREMSLAAAACGADGLIIEVHNSPELALCDGAQSLTPEEFDVLAYQVNKLLEVTGEF